MAAHMAMSVLCPNGRRQIVKVTPNTSLLHILEEACKKQGFSSDEHDLKSGNKVLDLSLSVRFANIPNNACLEMCPSVSGRRSKSPVTVGLQLEDGRRLLNDFDCSTSLAEIINYWKEKSGEDDITGDGEPVCIYLRKEVIGEKALTETTLQSLGLIGGKAMIRLIYRSKEVLGKQAYVEALLPAKQESIEWGTESTSNASNNDDWGNKEVTWDAPSQSNESNNGWGKMEEENLKQNTSSLKSDEENYKENTVGQPVDNWLSENSSREDDMPFENANDTLASGFAEDVEMKEEKIVYLGERDAVLFDLNSIPQMIHADLPDEFFELTIEDAKLLLGDLRKQRRELEDQPLELASSREARKREYVERYRQTVIRVHFPDRLVLQAKFTPLESVSAVSSFVKKFLENPDETFHLYTTPPKVTLDPGQDLLSANLVPAANVYFGAEVIRDVYLKGDILQQISTLGAASQAAAKLRNADGINGRPTKRSSEMDISLQSDDSGGPIKRAPDVSQPSTAQNPRPKSTGSGVPKWFKLK